MMNWRFFLISLGFFSDFTNYNRLEFNLSINRAFKINRLEKSALWSTMYGAMKFEDVDGIEWCLKEWPLSWINWPSMNSHRIDVLIDPEPNRDQVFNFKSRPGYLLSPSERTDLRWNDDVYDLDNLYGLYSEF